MKNCSRVVTFLGAALLAATMVGPALAAPKPPPPTGDFVKRDGADLTLTGNYTAITFDAYDQSSTAWGYLKLAIKDSAGHWCGNGGVSLQTNDRGPMTMSINLTSCGAWNGMLQQMLFYSSGNAYVDNFVAM